MDRGDYFEAKAALQNVRCVLLENAAREAKAHQIAAEILKKLGVPPASAYSWDDATLTITPVEAGHGR